MVLPPAGVSQRVADDAFTSPMIGAPGVYFVPAVPADYLSLESMDVAGFVGVAPRGPAWETTTDPDVDNGDPFRARSVATPVDSWDDYLELFGGFEGPGLLPYAVSAYFAQGGRRAYVVRVVGAGKRRPAPTDVPDGCARFVLRLEGDRATHPMGKALPTGEFPVWARSEGSWGNRLRIGVLFRTRPLEATLGPHEAGQPSRLVLPPAGAIAVGSTIRMSRAKDEPVFCTVQAIVRVGRDTSPGNDTLAVLDRELEEHEASFDVVEADVRVTDTDPLRMREERFQAVGLSLLHPRFLCTVVNNESRLVQVCDPPTSLVLDPSLRALASSIEADDVGLDLWQQITPEDLLGRLTEPGSTGGIGALGTTEEVATVVVPDLYSPGDLPGELHPAPAPDPPGWFVRCRGTSAVEAPDVPTQPGLEGLRLDPADTVDRRSIVELQQSLVSSVEALGRVVLLDVPPGLTPAQVLGWRSGFDSMFAAAYHPWVRVRGAGGQLVLLPPSSMAAGEIARTELVHGLAHGPANELATDVIGLQRAVAPEEHAELHRLGVNVFQIDPDGVRVTGARTLSTDSAWRQLSVRRLLLAIEKTVRRQLQWTVFEPNDERLRDSLRRQLDGLMSALFAQGCFAGSTHAESWFVQIASGAAAREEVDSGQVVVQLGVAPSAPLEFIIVRVAVQAEGIISTSTVTGPGVGNRA